MSKGCVCFFFARRTILSLTKFHYDHRKSFDECLNLLNSFRIAISLPDISFSLLRDDFTFILTTSRRISHIEIVYWK